MARSGWHLALALLAAAIGVIALWSTTEAPTQPTDRGVPAPTATTPPGRPAITPALHVAHPAHRPRVVPRRHHHVAPSSAPGPRFRVLRIAQLASPSEAAAATDRCIGPIEYRWHDIIDVVQHNYCGGAAMVAVAQGDVIRIIGGDISGTYRVNGRRFVVPIGAPMTSTAGVGDVALQTCISRTQAVFVGLTRIG